MINYNTNTKLIKIFEKLTKNVFLISLNILKM